MAKPTKKVENALRTYFRANSPEQNQDLREAYYNAACGLQELARVLRQMTDETKDGESQVFQLAHSQFIAELGHAKDAEARLNESVLGAIL